MKIGTSSFEIHGRNNNKKMALPAAKRRKIIAATAQKYSPDLLVCAGYSLTDNNDLKLLSEDENIRKGCTADLYQECEVQL